MGSPGKSTILMLFTRKDGDFNSAMLVYRRVLTRKLIFIWDLGPFFAVDSRVEGS